MSFNDSIVECDVLQGHKDSDKLQNLSDAEVAHHYATCRDLQQQTDKEKSRAWPRLCKYTNVRVRTVRESQGKVLFQKINISLYKNLQ